LDSSKIKLKLKRPNESITDVMEAKNQHYMTTRKKKIKKIDLSNKHSKTISKSKNGELMNQSCIPGMQYCLFKRECDDDQILEGFLQSHLLEYDEHNINAVREFAENSIEAPIDFKTLIKKLQKINVIFDGLLNVNVETKPEKGREQVVQTDGDDRRRFHMQ
jgi:hypothetical protein